MPPLIVFGFLLALLYERTGSIMPGILLHMLNNIDRPARAVSAPGGFTCAAFASRIPP